MNSNSFSAPEGAAPASRSVWAKIRALLQLVNHRFWIASAAVLSLIYGLSVLAYVLLAPDIGIRCAFTTVVNHFYPQFLDPSVPDQEPMEPSDTIVQLDSTPIKNWPDLLLYLKDIGSDQTVRVHFRRGGPNGLERSVVCRSGLPPIDNLVPSIAWFFLKLGLFVVGAIVFWNRPQDRSASQFFLLSIVSLGAFIGGYHWSRIVTQPVLLLGFMTCSILLPAVTLHFYMLFPRPKAILQHKPRRVLALVYSPALFFLALLVTEYALIRWLDRTNSSQLVDALLWWMKNEIYVYFAVAAIWYLASIACLIHSYRLAVTVTERDQVRWIMFGSMVALVPISYTLYLAMWDQERFGSGGGSWPMFAASLCFTIAFTISITRYRLLQIDQVLSSGMVYFLVSGFAGLIYYGLVFVGMLVVGSGVIMGPSVGQALVVSSTALLLMLGLDTVRGRLKSMLDRHYRREKRQLDGTLQRMSQAIEQLVDPTTLARRLLHTSADLLNVSSGAVYLRQGDPPLYLMTDALGPAPALTELSSGCPLIEALRLRATVVARPRPAPADPAQRQLHFINAGIAQALSHEGQLLGLLVLGQRIIDPYTREDLNLLSAVSQLSVLALVSAEGHRKIEGLNHELQSKVEKIAEQQRRILALQSQLNARSRGTAVSVPADKPTNGSETASAETAKAPATAMPEGMVGSSPQVQQLMHLVRKVAASPSAVLLRGESGTGKELLARALHESSARTGKAFIKVHCAALSPTLLESELFGHVKGAFTSAIRDKVGRFEAAHGGTLFLDEIGDISLEVQTKLLRVLQEKTFERVGSSEPMRVDVRLIAATHQDLEGLIETGRFRQDLYYRLNVISIAVPPLRDRVEDIPELAQHFIRVYAARAGREPLHMDDDALALLKAHPWPGNIRELENVIERAVVIAEGQVLTAAELPIEVSGGTAIGIPNIHYADGHSFLSDDDLTEPASILISSDATRLVPPSTSLATHARAETDRREREQLVRALSSAGGNKSEAARALGVARSTLVSRLKRLGLS